MNFIWILIAGIVLIGVVIGVILYVIYRNRQMQSLPATIEYNAVTTPSVQPVIETVPIRYTPPIERDYRPFKVVGARDGSWFQVLDRQGDIVARFSTPTGEPTFEAECPQGQVELIGIRSTPEGERIGPIGCALSAVSEPSSIQYVGQEGNVERIYSLGRVLGSQEGDSCPSPYRKLLISDGATGVQNGNIGERINNGIQYICIPDNQCQFHRDCPEGTICSGGECIPIEGILDF